jgi:hypothetical protein
MRFAMTRFLRLLSLLLIISVIDRILPLACGGADAPNNMQWQSVADAKSKDKTERIACR